jgi:Putative Actinobacterial Holin-X, holin superfamily III
MNQDAPALSTALDRVVDAAQEVVSDHVRIARLEAKLTLVRTVEAVGMLVFAATPFLLGWSALMAALQVILAAYVDPACSLAGIGILNLAPAIWMARRALRHVSREDAEHGGTS